jgi:putative aminopeptidase FrvX
MQESFALLKKLCSIHAPSGNEGAMTDFLLAYIGEHAHRWKQRPEVFSGTDFQDCIVLVFGQPRTAVFAHIDSIGFTVRYNRELVRIGSPHFDSGTLLVGHDRLGPIECSVQVDDENRWHYSAKRELDRGTDLTFKPQWIEDELSVQCCYMDNRLGVWNALRLCETLEHGAIVFSCWEEHGGGSVPFLTRFLWERYGIRQALISDVTWVTEGVPAGKGPVVSLRDSGIPRRRFVDRILWMAEESGIPFQREVEGSGGSDGTELQKQPYPIDWCFIGPPEENVHSPNEKVHKADISGNLALYRYLMLHL